MDRQVPAGLGGRGASRPVLQVPGVLLTEPRQQWGAMSSTWEVEPPPTRLCTPPPHTKPHIFARARTHTHTHTHTHTYGYCVCGFLAPRASGLTWPAWKRFPSCLNLLHHLSSYRTGVGRSRVSLGDRGRGQERTRPWRAGLLAHLPESPLSPPSLCSRLSFRCRPSTPPSSRNSHPAPLWGPWPPCWVCSPSSLLLS